MAITNLTAGEPLRCSSVANTDKEFEKAIDEWKAAVGTPRETDLKNKTEENSKLFFQALRNCNEAKLERNIVTIVSLIVAGISFLLTIVGFFVRRKKAIT